MAFDRKLWLTKFPSDAIPPFPCPTCDHGTLALVPDTLREIQPTHNERLKHHDAWEPDWVRKQFTLLLKCSIKDCGEVVGVCGNTVVVEGVDEEFGWVYYDELAPRAMWPSPSIIDIPEEMPSDVTESLKLAFFAFWNDVGLCANRLRTSAEQILDDLKIPSQKIGNKGQTIPINFNERVQQLKKINQDHGETMDALRYIGNLGTHGGEVMLEAILDAFHIYEDALAELYGKRSETTKAIRRKIIAAKGDYAAQSKVKQ